MKAVQLFLCFAEAKRQNSWLDRKPLKQSWFESPKQKRKWQHCRLPLNDNDKGLLSVHTALSGSDRFVLLNTYFPSLLGKQLTTACVYSRWIGIFFPRLFLLYCDQSGMIKSSVLADSRWKRWSHCICNAHAYVCRCNSWPRQLVISKPCLPFSAGWPVLQNVSIIWHILNCQM